MRYLPLYQAHFTMLQRVFFALVCLLISTNLMAQDYPAEWKKVDKLNQEGKFRSALEAADELYTLAEQQGDVDEQLKALFHRTAYLGRLEEDGQEAMIAFLRKTLSEQSNETFLSVNHFVLARSYFDYLQQARNRGTQEDNESIDADLPLAEWSIARLVKTGTDHLLQALELAEKADVRLNRIPAIVKRGERLEFQKPTLYDVLVYDALQLLNRYDGYLIEPTYAFRPTAEQLLAKARDFNVAVFDSQDSSLLFRSTVIYQNLLKKYQNDPTQKATFVYADLQRLNWAYGQRKEKKLFFTRLSELHQQYQGTEGAGAVLLRQVDLMRQFPELGYTGDPENNKVNVRILEVLAQIQRLYPASQEAYSAENQANSIKSPSLQIRSEKINLANQHLLVNVNYQNVDQLYYRLLPREFSLEEEREDVRERITKLQKLKPLQSSRIRLAANDDYANHSTEFAIDPLAPGHYDLMVSGDASFDVTKSPVQVVKLEVSKLGMLELRAEKENQLLVIDRETGAALSNVSATFYHWTGDYRNRKLEKLNSDKSNQEGYLDAPSEARNLTVLLEKGNDRVIIPFSSYSNYYSNSRYREDRILTDRGIYRPGQTVYFKGVMLVFSPEGVPSVHAKSKTTVYLRDANYQNVGEVEVTSDEYGSFNGSFELPTGGLNGNFTISTEEGNTNFRVEAYKRPRFEVKFPPDQGNILANEAVSITGSALGYAGPPVSGATVNYRVMRSEQSLPWYFYRGYNSYNRQEEAVIATGTTTTDDDGNFTINFTAELPENANPNQRFRPGYQFEISVDVADQTGETHSATTSRNVRQQGATISFSAPTTVDAATLDELKVNLNYVGGQNPEAKDVKFVIQPVSHPDPGLISRRWSSPDRPTISKADFKQLFPLFAYQEAPDVEKWPTAGQQFYERTVTIAADSSFTVSTSGLTAGHYRLAMSYPFDGETKTAYQQLTVVDSKTGELPADVLYHYTDATQQSYPAGTAYARTLLAKVPMPLVLTSLMSRGTKQVHQRKKAENQLLINHTIQPDDRGGMIESFAFARYNRYFSGSSSINVPWPEKELQFAYETFRDKLRPGEEESWKIKITDHEGKPVGSQLLASMYDASLDQILPFNWKNSFSPYPNSYYTNSRINSFLYQNINGVGNYEPKVENKDVPYFISPSLDLGPFAVSFIQSRRIAMYSLATESADAASMKSSAPPAPGGRRDTVMIMNLETYSEEPQVVSISEDEPEIEGMDAGDAANATSTASVSIRKNLQETAFWFPELQTDKDGNVILAFAAPEALTRWKLQLFAHTPDLEYAFSEREVITQKELMILPNAPRFLREGDRIEFTAKVSNLSDKLMAATTYLELFDPETEELILDFKVAALGEKSNEQAVILADGESKTVAWSITVPDNSAGLIGYRVVVKAGNLSDGEQNVLPVLSNRIFLTAGKPFYVKPGKKETVSLDALKAAATSGGNLQHQGFSFELTADPSWLVVKSLPYLMEYPYDCTEQIANRFFANQLSYTIVNGNPALRNVFEAWKKDPDALTSPLALNQDLKQAALEETPWLREAADESEQRERLAVLFDLNKLAAEQEATLNKLVQRQNPDGSFSWFPGGPENRYMTQYVAETMIRLDQLGALKGKNRDQALSMTAKTLDFLDFKAEEDYARIMTLDDPELHRPSSIILHYLYVRSTPTKGVNEVSKKAKDAYGFFLQQAEKYWLDYGLYEQAMLSITFKRAGSEMSKIIMASLRERAIKKDEFGMYWKYPRGFSWQQLPIETHCRIIEAFQVNGASKEELDEMRLYLLQNKRTNRWETTKATAAAAYAFLQTDGDLLKVASSQKVQVTFPDLNKSVYQPQLAAAENTAEAGTGYYRVQWAGDQVTDDFAKVQLKNKGKRIAWGAMYWQYTQDIDAVVANNDNPLQLQRKLFRRINTDAGQRLEEITAANSMKPGERLVVKLVITTDRDLEYVHLKDRRAASLEPTEQLSRYAYESGLGFYFSPDDLAVHYFFDYLPRGTYNLEYDLFVNHAGEFSNGLSVIQSMYAPEFSAYSAGSSLKVER